MKSEHSPIAAASRWPLMALIFSGAVWLVVSSVISLAASIQLHSPSFLSECPALTYGRLVPMAETAFVYGWLGSAGLGIALWILGRLAGEPLRAQAWALWGTAFWNVGVLTAIIGIMVGDRTGYTFLEIPRYAQLILFFAYGTIAVPGILAWSGRLREVAFVSQWYAAAALFIFPWILSIAHVFLFAHPARGVLQAVVAGWYTQSLWNLWIAPLALAGAYYVVPKMTGKVIPSYEFAPLGFWTLLFVGGLTAGRHLVGSPVPAWVPSLAVVSLALLSFHVLVVFLNLRNGMMAGGVSAVFIGAGLVAYAANAILDVVMTFHGAAALAQFTLLESAVRQLALYGAASLLLFGSITFALPRINGKSWLSPFFTRAHLVLTLLGVVLLVGSLAFAGSAQGHDLLDASVGFDAIAAHMKPWLLVASAAQLVLVLANTIFLVNSYGTMCEILKLSKPAVFNPPAAVETHAS
jgi:cytochrome c oxidase cbb3-type subunit I